MEMFVLQPDAKEFVVASLASIPGHGSVLRAPGQPCCLQAPDTGNEHPQPGLFPTDSEQAAPAAVSDLSATRGEN